MGSAAAPAAVRRALAPNLHTLALPDGVGVSVALLDGEGAVQCARGGRAPRVPELADVPVVRRGGWAGRSGRSARRAKIAQHFRAGLPVRNRSKSRRDDRIPPNLAAPCRP